MLQSVLRASQAGTISRSLSRSWWKLYIYYWKSIMVDQLPHWRGCLGEKSQPGKPLRLFSLQDIREFSIKVLPLSSFFFFLLSEITVTIKAAICHYGLSHYPLSNTTSYWKYKMLHSFLFRGAAAGISTTSYVNVWLQWSQLKEHNDSKSENYFCSASFCNNAFVLIKMFVKYTPFSTKGHCELSTVSMLNTI